MGESTLTGILAGAAGSLAPGYKVIYEDPEPGASPAGAARKRRLVLMSPSQSGTDALIKFSELDEAGHVIASSQHRVPGLIARLCTDFVVTNDWWVFES